MLLPDEQYERDEAVTGSTEDALRTLRACDQFLRIHNIKPDFFCRYNEKKILQEALSAAESNGSFNSQNSKKSKRKQISNGKIKSDASSSNEAVHLQQRLLSLSTELVSLRNHLHSAPPPPLPHPAQRGNAGSVQQQQPAVPPRAPPHGPPPALPASFPPDPIKPRWSAPSAALDVDDLIHLPGPLTEDALLKSLHMRFYANKYYTNIGPILVAVNAYTDAHNPLTLTGVRSAPRPELTRLVRDAVRQQSDTGYPQAIILSGVSGSGKTYASMLLLRRLFDVAGGGPETDAFKHLAAAFTVLRSLGSASTASNSESSRIGHFIEVQVTDGALYRTKIHCYFLDQTRVIRPPAGEKNYHIFYQMLAGLSQEERIRLHLDGRNPHNLRYLRYGNSRQNEAEDGARFQAWKACLGILGIPFLDVVRVLAAVMLLGNVQFTAGVNGEVELQGDAELNSAAALLGVAPAALYRGFSSRARLLRGQLLRAPRDPDSASVARDSLAKALYCRTVATIVRRANSLKRLGSTLGTLSSDSNESVHARSDRRSTATGGSNNAGSRSMAVLNSAVKHANDGFVGILDMFGFEDASTGKLEHLCVNLCAETMQHFYNTHIFKSSVESCREEGINCDLEVEYADNVPCIDLVSSLRSGLLAALDAECAAKGTPESYVRGVKTQHRDSDRLFEPRPPETRMFGVRHFAGDVIYDATDFLEANRDVVPDDLVATFDRRGCDFGFATHLFGAELKALSVADGVPRGASFRASPTSHAEPLDTDEPTSTLTQDFHTRLDNLLRTLVHARPHFVRCVRANKDESPEVFDRVCVAKQIRALQTLETVGLMAGGYPHRMRFRAFAGRYRALGPKVADRDSVEACAAVLHALAPICARVGGASIRYALGKRHVFFSEGMRQVLELRRAEVRHLAATRVQAAWRGWRLRRVTSTGRTVSSTSHSAPPAAPRAAPPAAPRAAPPPRPRPAPIAGTPPPDPAEKCDPAVVRRTCTLLGLDLERPPPLPPSRSYTVQGGIKVCYPQTRVMRGSYGSGTAQLRAGEHVTVLGAGRRGHVVVKRPHGNIHVPYHLLEPPHATRAPIPTPSSDTSPQQAS